MRSWGGSIDAWHDQDTKVLHTAVTGDTKLPILIYPDESDATTYVSGNALFGSNTREGSMDGAITDSAEYIGDGTPTFTGWTS